MVGGCTHHHHHHRHYTTCAISVLRFVSRRALLWACGRNFNCFKVDINQCELPCRARAVVPAFWVGLVVFVERIQSANVISRARRESARAPVGREIDGTHVRRVRARCTLNPGDVGCGTYAAAS